MSAKGTLVLHNIKIKILWDLCSLMHFGFTSGLRREPSIRETDACQGLKFSQVEFVKFDIHPHKCGSELIFNFYNLH